MKITVSTVEIAAAVAEWIEKNYGLEVNKSVDMIFNMDSRVITGITAEVEPKEK